MKRIDLAMVALATLALTLSGAAAQPDSSTVMDWTIDGQKREAIVIAPTKKSDHVPVVLVFHGHGGTMRAMERKGFHKHWPEAIVVCPQGLPTATPRDPEGKRSGWQTKPGSNKDRDLLFVDAILKTLRDKHKIDDKRIYATGHSNGGGFTYLLWTARGKELAAVAPSSSGGAGLVLKAKALEPLPVLHLAGEKDEIVLFENQKRTMEVVRKQLGCDATGKEWAKSGDLVGTLYASKDGPPFVTLIHPGTHRYPDEATELIVKFFKEHARR